MGFDRFHLAGHDWGSIVPCQEEAFGLYRNGRLDENIWEGITKQYASFLSHRGFRHVWEFRCEYYNQEFRHYVDNLPTSEYKIRVTPNDAQHSVNVRFWPLAAVQSTDSLGVQG